jgi:hypothetical protein
MKSENQKTNHDKKNKKRRLIRTLLLSIFFIIFLFNYTYTKPYAFFFLSIFYQSPPPDNTGKGALENPYEVPVSISFDITKKGNKVEGYVKIEDRWSYVPGLEFRYSEAELKNTDRIRKLMGYHGMYQYYPGIKTPVHLMVARIEKDGSEEVVFDKIDIELGRFGHAPASQKVPLSLSLSKGTYKVIAYSIKDLPEFTGTKIYFRFAKPGGK